MYPKQLEYEKQHSYFSEEEYFKGQYNYIHTYLHTDYNYKMHSHQFYEVNIITSGEGRHYIDRINLPTVAGDVFVIPPGIRHGYYSEGRLNIYHILIKTEFLHRYGEELSQMQGFDLLFDIEPQIRQASGTRLNLNARATSSADFEAELDHLIHIEAEQKHTYLNVLTLAFICKLCERVLEASSVTREYTTVIRAMEYIKSHLESKLTLDMLSDVAHVSAATLNRQFRATVGQTPMQYVTACRIAKAKRLIEEAHISRTDVALACGFYDTSHMNKYL